MPKTAQDLVAPYLADADKVAADDAARVAAEAAEVTEKTQQTADTAALAAAIKLTGPFFVLSPDGNTVTVFAPDTAPPEFTMTTYKAAGTITVPDAPPPPPPPVAPVVSSISPATGPAAGGTSVTLTGTGFTGATAANFGTVAGTSLSVASDTSVLVTSPAGTGAVDVTIATPAGTSASSSADTFTYDAAPPSVSLPPFGTFGRRDEGEGSVSKHDFR